LASDPVVEPLTRPLTCRLRGRAGPLNICGATLAFASFQSDNLEPDGRYSLMLMRADTCPAMKSDGHMRKTCHCSQDCSQVPSPQPSLRQLSLRLRIWRSSATIHPSGRSLSLQRLLL